MALAMRAPSLVPLLVRCVVLAAAVAVATPAQNQALQLTTGIDGGVAYAFDARMVPPTGITVEAWITYDDATLPLGGTYWPTIARQNVTPQQESWNLRVSAGGTGARNLQFIVRTQSNTLHAATYSFAPGEFLAFTHVAGTFDGQQIRLWKDAVQVASFTIPALSEVVNNGGELRLGNGDPVLPGNETWNGTIDMVRIWPMARDAAELAATRQLDAVALPGGVLEFPLNGSYASADGTVLGTAYGTSAFVPGVTGLGAVAPLTLALGQPSTTCPRAAGMLAGSVAQVGNTAFTLWCVRGPRPTVSPAGALFAAAAPAPSGQPTVLGLSVAWDLTTLITSAVLVPPTNALGNASFALPIPAVPSLAGAGWVFQFAFFDNVCGAAGFSSSDGLLFTIQ
jgi:hypothetical protein